MSITELNGYRKKLNTGAIEAYLEEIEALLSGSPAKKERVLLGLREELAAFAAGKTVTAELLAQTFGTPEEVALSFGIPEEEEEASPVSEVKKPSKAVPVLLAVLILLVGVLIGVLLGKGMARGSEEVDGTDPAQVGETFAPEQSTGNDSSAPVETTLPVEPMTPVETAAPMGPSETAAPEGWETMDPSEWGTADGVHSQTPDGPYETAEPAIPAE